MVDWTIAGAGEHLLPSDLAALQAQTTVVPAGIGYGNAEPINYYHLGLYRFSINGWFLPAQPFDADFQFIPVPPGATSFSWNMTGTAEMGITEVASTSALPLGNPLRIEQYVMDQYANGFVGTVWAYTVPSNRAARVYVAQASVQAGLSPNARSYIQTATALIAYAASDNAGSLAGFTIANLINPLPLFSGEEIYANVVNESGSVATCWATLEAVEYDFDAFTP